MRTDSRFWFPAKRYGWGWGLPATWQGWVVLGLYAASLAAAAVVFPPSAEMMGFVGAVAILTGLLVAVCWLKGEPPRWRWGRP